MKKVTMSKSPSTNRGCRGQGSEVRMRSRSLEKKQLRIAEAARGRRQERSMSREAKARRAAEVRRASSRLSRSQSRDKRVELAGPKGVQVKLDMIEMK